MLLKKKLTEVNRSPDEFKEESIQLVINSDGVLETTSEAKNILTALIKEKLWILSINGKIEK